MLLSLHESDASVRIGRNAVPPDTPEILPKDVLRMEERVIKILSRYGLCSRRTAEAWIRQGRVTVNGHEVVTGEKADMERDTVCVDDRPLDSVPRLAYVMLHKPRGFITTTRDDRGRKTVMELITDCPFSLWPVGRLDYDSEGLLLFTNDGCLTQMLTHPKHEIPKTYHVLVTGSVAAGITTLRHMDTLEGKSICRPIVHFLRREKKGTWLSVVIHEGKNRQIRRMCDAVHLKVMRLKRVAEGDVSLGDLPSGKWRYLTEDEVGSLKDYNPPSP